MKSRYLNIILLFLLLQSLCLPLRSQMVPLRVEPPSWWTDMVDPSVQLMVHGDNISESTVFFEKPGIFIEEVKQTDNPDYLFIDLVIEPEADPGMYRMIFEYQREIMATFDFELLARDKGSRERQGFGAQDVIYLVMPDRFANGDPGNDSITGMLEGPDPRNGNGRHGGDLSGITQRLDYMDKLGVTTVWLNPVLENDMPAYSYHGYAITDFYQVDARLGGNEAYLDFIKAAHQKGMKVIMDMVFNHCGDKHWWMDDLPAADWIHSFPEFTKSNFRAETLMDPYASDFDRTRMLSGWFDVHMPDLDQKNPFLAKYLIQNSIWWIEYAGLDGIRMDTYPYSNKDFMVEWIQRIRMEYPNFNVVGETWLQKESHTAYFQAGRLNKDGYDSDLPTVTDFPMQGAMIKAFVEAEGWTTGMARLYYILSQDFLYADPMNTVIFPDNHDLTRFFTSIHGNIESWKMAMAFLVTTRGIPMIYYGTEFLMTGEESAGHGYIRENFPLWDPVKLREFESSASSRQSSVVSDQLQEAQKSDKGMADTGPLSVMQIEGYDYLKKLLNWRRGAEVIHHGLLKQFVPLDGIYVYFRYDEENSVMVVMNNNEGEKIFKWERFAEASDGFLTGKNIIDGKGIIVGQEFILPPKSASIYELK